MEKAATPLALAEQPSRALSAEGSTDLNTGSPLKCPALEAAPTARPALILAAYREAGWGVGAIRLAVLSAYSEGTWSCATFT